MASPKVTKIAEEAKAKKAKVTSAKIKPADITKSKSGILTLPGMTADSMRVLIIGTAPLIMHKFSAKSEQILLDKHMGEATPGGREIKDPEANFEAARYRLTDGSDGIPAVSFKKSLVAMCGKDAGIYKSKAGAIRFIADDLATGLCRIITPDGQPTMHQEIVRNANGMPDIRHRPHYWPWAALLQISFVERYASPARILQITELSGYMQGCGEKRPGKSDHQNGTFRLADSEEIAAFENDRLFEVVTGMMAAAE